MSRKHRHRDHKVKTMHSIIGDYDKVLEDIGRIPAVRSVITGVISPNKSDREEMTFQYFTDSGLKLLAKTTEAVQEIFLVSEDKQQVLEELQARGFLTERMNRMKKNAPKKPTAPQSSASRRDARYNASDLPKDAKPATLKDLLNADVLAKLQAQSQELKDQERAAEEKKRQAEVERRAREQKELDNNFEHLLKNSKMDWKNFK